MQLIGRKLNSNIFDTGKRVGDNIVKGVSLSNGLNYRDKATGIILPVDITVFEETDYEFTHKVDKCRATLRFGDNSSNTKKHLFGIEDEAGNWLNVKLNLDGHNMSGVSNNRPTFPDSDGLTVEHIPKYNGIKTNYRLGSSGINEITVTFKHNNEITPEQRGNTIVFTRDGKDIFHIKSPYAFDGDESNAIEPVIMVLGETGGFNSATLTVDSGWLATAVDPIIDPDVTIEDGVDGGIIEDAGMEDNTTANNFGGRSFHKVTNTVNCRNFAIKTDLSSYSPSITITFAKYTFNCAIGSSVAFSSALWPILRTWVEGSSNNVAEAGAICALSSRYLTEDWSQLNARGIGTDYNDTLATGTLNAPTSTGLFDVVLDNSIIQSRIGVTNQGDVYLADSYSGSSNYWMGSSEGSPKPQFYFEYIEGVDGVGNHFFFNSIPWIA